MIFRFFTVLLFTFYLVADGPRFRRLICSFLRPDRQREVLANWEIAIQKTGGYLYSRLLLGIIQAVFHYIAFVIIGVPYPLALALFVGVVSQFVPVVGTYIANGFPALIALAIDPVKAVWVVSSPSCSSRSRTTSPRPASPPARCRCTRRWPSDRCSPASGCSAPSGRSSPCRPRRCSRRSARPTSSATRWSSRT